MFIQLSKHFLRLDLLRLALRIAVNAVEHISVQGVIGLGSFVVHTDSGLAVFKVYPLFDDRAHKRGYPCGLGMTQHIGYFRGDILLGDYPAADRVVYIMIDIRDDIGKSDDISLKSLRLGIGML